MMCFQGCLSEIGLVNIYHHFPGFGGDGFMTTLLGQGCTATNINGNTFVARGPGSVVGIATAYGLDGPGIESRWGEIFRISPDRP